MAVTATVVGPTSPLNRNVERLLEEAQVSGELKISCRRLREFPKIAVKYNLNDTVYCGKCLRHCVIMTHLYMPTTCYHTLKLRTYVHIINVFYLTTFITYWCCCHHIWQT